MPAIGCAVLFTAAIHCAVAQDSTSVQAGEQIYEENCASCHGEKLRNPGTTFDLRKFHADQRERFNKFIMEGKGQMQRPVALTGFCFRRARRE